MAFLKFLKGDYSAINNAAVIEGQVLVSDNTSEMFVDVATDNRIKISDYITVANVDALPDASSVSTRKLYYVEDGNILVRSDSIKWIQVNKQRTKDELVELLNLQNIIENTHKHINKAALDNITIESIAAWNSAEKNIINSVNPTQFTIDENRNLTLLNLSTSQITGLVEALNNKVSKIEGSRLITEAEAAKLETIVLGENGSVEIGGTIAAGNIVGLGEWITARAGVLKGLSENNFTDILVDKLNGIEENAQVNKLEAITIGGTPLVVTNKIIDIPIATMEQLGVVKSSAEENKVAIEKDGTMEVNSVNVNKLVQTDGDTLILYSGTSV